MRKIKKYSVMHINAVKEILLRYWDPINVADNLKLSGEYDSYVPSILNALKNGFTSEMMLNILSEAENRIGVKVSADRRLKTVNALLEIKQLDE